MEFAMNRVARIINSRRLSRALEQRSGVPLAQLSVATLAAIRRRNGKARLTDVARRVGYDASRVSKEVQRLVAAGLVEQEREASDRRAYSLRVTDAGEEAYLHYRRSADDLLAAAMADWSDRDLRELVRLLTRLAESSAIPAEDLDWWPLPPAEGSR
jgi:DNA-binding MarR family transcriptional regulator